MAQQVPLDPSARAAEIAHNSIREVTSDLAYQRHLIVNVVFYGPAGAGDRNWVLVDAGVSGSAARIVEAADARFGEGARPAAIVLTHGHFDHVGALPHLAEKWDVPVYAHVHEHPFLNGSTSYPEPDPAVGGGIMATLSPLYPRGPVNLGDRLQPLPKAGDVPHMPGWRWIHTPGHTQGHVVLWRASDRSLIAGDAVITTAQESAYAVIVQKRELHGPPMYYTEDWELAKQSAEALQKLEPEILITGHGRAMQGPQMRNALAVLADQFEDIAIPPHVRER